jgi:tRNA threonylcarbamoyladenosine biosynthesis protein TsaB
MEFYMLVLALDTTTRRGSVALTRNRVLLGCESGDPGVTHGQRLPGDLVRLLDRHALGVGDVELFAVAAGPGSFTGLRIGIAIMQGLALAGGRSLIGVSALDALNVATRALPSAVSPQPSTVQGEVGVWMDAQRGQVFSALYQGEALRDGPTVEQAADVLRRWRARDQSGPITFVGEGAITYAPLIRLELPNAHVLMEVPQLAPSIALLAEDQALGGASLAPDAIRPIYVRRADVELARDRVGGPGTALDGRGR